MARQRQLDLRQLRQREHFVGDIGRHQIEDPCTDIEGLAFRAVGGDHLGAPWLGTARDASIGEEHEQSARLEMRLACGAYHTARFASS